MMTILRKPVLMSILDIEEADDDGDIMQADDDDTYPRRGASLSRRLSSSTGHQAEISHTEVGPDKQRPCNKKHC